MKPAPRGRFKTLVHDDGSPVTLVFHGTISVSPRVTAGGKTYTTIIISPEHPEHQLIHTVDTVIRAYQPNIAYSPILSQGRLLVVKIAATALADPDLVKGDRVEVHMKLGNYGAFGYCWVASNIFRATPNDDDV